MITAVSVAARGGFPAGFSLFGPGLPGDRVTDVLIFNAGRECGFDDALARFYAEEMSALDWLRDYLMDDHLATIPNDFEALFKVEEEIEDAYNKSDLTTVQTDGNWAEG